MTDENTIAQIARECARPIRGCATDEQYQEVIRRIIAALQECPVEND